MVMAQGSWGMELGELLTVGLMADSDVERGVTSGQVLEAAQALGALRDVFGEAAGFDAVLPAPRRVTSVAGHEHGALGGAS